MCCTLLVVLFIALAPWPWRTYYRLVVTWIYEKQKQMKTETNPKDARYCCGGAIIIPETVFFEYFSFHRLSFSLTNIPRFSLTSHSS